MYQFTIYTPFSDIWRYLLSHPPALLVSFSFHLDLVGKSVTSLLFIFHFFDFSLGRIFFSLWPYLLLWWTGVHFTLSILSLIPPSTTWNRCYYFHFGKLRNAWVKWPQGHLTLGSGSQRQNPGRSDSEQALSSCSTLGLPKILFCELRGWCNVTQRMEQDKEE